MMNIIEETRKQYEKVGIKVSIPYIIFGLIVYYVVLVSTLIYLPIHAYLSAWRGKASKYTGVKCSRKAFEYLNASRFPFMLETEQGPLAYVHGDPEGNYAVGDLVTNNIPQVFCVFPRGEYTIVSCYNGAHKDINYCGRKFTRDKNTITNYATLSYLFPWGTMIVFADKWSERILNLAQGKVSL